jgi:hypothetical protein
LALPGQILVRPARFVQFRQRSISGMGVSPVCFNQGEGFHHQDTHGRDARATITPAPRRFFIAFARRGVILTTRMPEESSPESNRPVPAKISGPRRRGRRGGRGRGRGLRPPAPEGAAEPPPVADPAAPVEAASPVEALPPQNEPPIRLREEMPVRPAPSSARFQPAIPVQRAVRTDGSAISQAVNEVMRIVESLRRTLEDMEEVLELVEIAERQKITDEREIEALLRALRQFQSRGERPERPEFPERRERFSRPERPPRPARPGQNVRPQNPERPAPPERVERLDQPEPPENFEPSEGPEPQSAD